MHLYTKIYIHICTYVRTIYRARFKCPVSVAVDGNGWILVADCMPAAVYLIRQHQGVWLFIYIYIDIYICICFDVYVYI